MTQPHEKTLTESSLPPYRAFRTLPALLLCCFLSATPMFAEPFLLKATGTFDSANMAIPETTTDFVFEIVVDNGGASTADQHWNAGHLISATVTSGTYVMNWKDCSIIPHHLKILTDSAGQVKEVAFEMNGYYCGGAHDNFGSSQAGQNGTGYFGSCTPGSSGAVQDTTGRNNKYSPATRSQFCHGGTDYSNWSAPVLAVETCRWEAAP